MAGGPFGAASVIGINPNERDAIRIAVVDARDQRAAARKFSTS
jgi:hypothetical protein